MLGLMLAASDGAATLLWILAVIIVGLLVGPGGVSIFT